MPVVQQFPGIMQYFAKLPKTTADHHWVSREKTERYHSLKSSFVLVRLDHLAGCIINADHSVM
jgi:hypothetical protein